jgi:hypothetical protein
MLSLELRTTPHGSAGSRQSYARPHEVLLFLSYARPSQRHGGATPPGDERSDAPARKGRASMPRGYVPASKLSQLRASASLRPLDEAIFLCANRAALGCEFSKNRLRAAAVLCQRAAFDNPIAITCFALFAPCLPSGRDRFLHARIRPPVSNATFLRARLPAPVPELLDHLLSASQSSFLKVPLPQPDRLLPESDFEFLRRIEAPGEHYPRPCLRWKYRLPSRAHWNVTGPQKVRLARKNCLTAYRRLLGERRPLRD